MRIQTSKLRLSQKPAHARMIKRNLLTSLLLYEKVRTTKKRAKVVQPLVDRLIQIAKTKEPYLAIRSINQVITDKNASKKVMEVFVKRYANRDSGLTRIVPVGARKGDGAEVVELVLVDADVSGKQKAEGDKNLPAQNSKPTTKKATTKAS